MSLIGCDRPTSGWLLKSIQQITLGMSDIQSKHTPSNVGEWEIFRGIEIFKNAYKIFSFLNKIFLNIYLPIFKKKLIFNLRILFKTLNYLKNPFFERWRFKVLIFTFFVDRSRIKDRVVNQRDIEKGSQMTFAWVILYGPWRVVT